MQLVLMNNSSSNLHDRPVSAGAAAAAAQAAANLDNRNVTSESGVNANDAQTTTTSTPSSDYRVDQDTAATANSMMAMTNNSITLDSSSASAKNTSNSNNGNGKPNATNYLYKDYSNVNDLESIEGYNSDSNNGNSNNPTPAAVAAAQVAAAANISANAPAAVIHDAHTMRLQKFPAKLESILSRPEWSDIVTWMPHGRSWKVSLLHSHRHISFCSLVFFGVIYHSILCDFDGIIYLCILRSNYKSQSYAPST